MKLSKIKKNNDYRVVYRRGKSISNKLLVLYIFPNKSNQSRIGISVSKKVGKSVVRSRVKRLILENYRLNIQFVKNGYDLVFIARNSSKDSNYNEIRIALLELIRRAGLYNEKVFNDTNKVL